MKLYRTGKKLVWTYAIAACFALPISALAADLTVAQGDSQTISADVTYDAVVVNGNLAIANGITLTCTSLTVADNIDGTATLAVGDNARVEVSGTSLTKIGVGAGRAEVVMGTNAYFKAQGYLNFCYGYDSQPADDARMTEALLIVGSNSTVYCGTDFCFGHRDNSNANRPGGSRSSGATTIKARVRLDDGAAITTQRLCDYLPLSEQILFNGGRIIQRSGDYKNSFVIMPSASKYSRMNLDGTNSCPIAFELQSRGSLKSFASYGSKSCYVLMSGDGGFLKTGAAVFPLIDSSSQFWDGATNLRFLFTGDFVVSEGGFSISTSPTNNVLVAEGAYSRPLDVVVKNGATFDLAGCDIVVNSISATGSGVVTNSAETAATATIGVREDGRDSTLARAFPGVAIVKQGGSTLSMCGADVDSIDLRGGTLVLKDRVHTGYPFYRFQVDAIREDVSNGTKRVIVRDVALQCAGVDVTRPYAALHHDASGTSTTVSPPANLVDGDLETTYDDYRATGGVVNRARVGVTIEYGSCLVVDSYCWAPRYSVSNELDPAKWRMFGGFSTTDLAVLDQVTGFRVTDVVDGWNSTNFVFTSNEPSSMHIGTLTIADGVSVKMEGAQVSCGTLELGADCSLYVRGDRSSIKGNLLSASSCSGTENLDGWSIYHNDERLDRKLFFDGNAVRLFPLGIMLIVE